MSIHLDVNGFMAHSVNNLKYKCVSCVVLVIPLRPWFCSMMILGQCFERLCNSVINLTDKNRGERGQNLRTLPRTCPSFSNGCSRNAAGGYEANKSTL